MEISGRRTASSYTVASAISVVREICRLDYRDRFIKSGRDFPREAREKKYPIPLKLATADIKRCLRVKADIRTTNGHTVSERVRRDTIDCNKNWLE